jgi:AcrR family transcriptional regulator
MGAKVEDSLRARVPTQNRGLKRMAAIRKATLACLMEGDVRDLKVGEIARAAGVAVGTFYHYFPSKEALLLELRRELMTETAGTLAAAFQKQFQETGNFLASLRVLLDHWVEVCLGYQGLEQAIQAMALENPDVAAYMDKQEEQVRGLVSGIIRQHAEFVRQCDVDRAAYTMVAVVDGAVVRIMRDPSLAGDDAWFLDEVVRMVGHYIMPDKLMERIE